jgi:hypothetical protein
MSHCLTPLAANLMDATSTAGDRRLTTSRDRLTMERPS